MNQRTLYKVEEVPLKEQRLKGANSRLGPRQIQADFTHIYVLTLTGTASLSFSLAGRGDYFDLRQGMRITMPEGTKNISIINDPQPNKKLVLFLGYKDEFEVVT